MQETDNEASVGHIAAMGPELGNLYHAVSSELGSLHWRWGEYRVLFGEKPSRIDLMNQSAPFFFSVVHDALFESTLLGIARLVGPPSSVGKPNLTIRRFEALIADAPLKVEIVALVDRAQAAADFAMEWRNRHIAHRDLHLALNVSPNPLPIATKEKVDSALSALHQVLGKVEVAYCKSTTLYARSPWGAKTLLTLVQGGLLREQEKRACWGRLERHQDDVNPPAEV
jgi:hypothetical protein